ncbi:hypothetical protein M885DRAFT_611061 [Pelagophyceae sp. CCMP2097]|nr:hypothetical protein M885DRAFT_611061 [Pelagophyceae sp. CCMP2097]
MWRVVLGAWTAAALAPRAGRRVPASRGASRRLAQSPGAGSSPSGRRRLASWQAPRGAAAQAAQRRSLWFLGARKNFVSVGRVVLPAALAAFAGVSYFDNCATYINEHFLDSTSIQFLSSDDIQFIPSFLTVLSLLFSILAGNAYQSLYSQQEEIYFALYAEVSEAKSLLEQLALICSGRPFYVDALRALRAYIKNDLRRLDVPPSELISRSPSQDPLEAIMYLTSVGVPSVIYDTVRDLRQARGKRLGAMQRKFPQLGIVLLYILALLELAAFPLLGAGTAVGASESIFNVQGALFGGLCGATTLVLRIIQELWRTSGGAFNVDVVLTTMVRGLVEELDARAADANRNTARQPDAADAWADDADDELARLRRRVDELESLGGDDRRRWPRRWLDRLWRPRDNPDEVAETAAGAGGARTGEEAPPLLSAQEAPNPLEWFRSEWISNFESKLDRREED